jgi:hypothetical protein
MQATEPAALLSAFRDQRPARTLPSRFSRRSLAGPRCPFLGRVVGSALRRGWLRALRGSADR